MIAAARCELQHAHVGAGALQVYSHPGALAAIRRHTAERGITTPVATMLVLLAHSREHAERVLASQDALHIAVAAAHMMVQLEDESPAALCALVATFSSRLRQGEGVADALVSAGDIETVVGMAEEYMAGGGGSEDEEVAAGADGWREGGIVREDMEKLVRTWPGDRHENDCRDYRDVAVAPVWAELAPGAPAPFLPAADGGDMFLASQVRSIDMENPPPPLRQRLSLEPGGGAEVGSHSRSPIRMLDLHRLTTGILILRGGRRVCLVLAEPCERVQHDECGT